MPVRTHKRRKKVRQRGYSSHGWGAKKKHRGSGNRGGAGRAGSLGAKRGQNPNVREDFGKHGFKKKNASPESAVNCQFLEAHGDAMIRSSRVSPGSMITVNLTALGIDKLLSKGNIAKKFHVTVRKASPLAVEKIHAAGGKVETESEGKREAEEA